MPSVSVDSSRQDEGILTISLGPVSGATKYRVRETVGGSNQIHNVSASTRQITLDNKSSGSYTYCANAGNNAGWSSNWGSGGQCETVTVSRTLPDAPQFNAISDTQTGTFTLSWSVPDDPHLHHLHRIKLFRRTGLAGSFINIPLPDDVSSSYTETNLQPGEYTYRLTAYNSSNDSVHGQLLNINMLSPVITDAGFGICGAECVQVEGAGFDPDVNITLTNLATAQNVPVSSFNRENQGSITIALTASGVQTLADDGLTIRVINPNQADAEFSMSAQRPGIPSVSQSGVISEQGTYTITIAEGAGGPVSYYRLYENTVELDETFDTVNPVLSVEGKDSGTYTYCAQAVAMIGESNIGTGQQCTTVEINRAEAGQAEFVPMPLQQTGQFDLQWQSGGGDTSYYELRRKEGAAGSAQPYGDPLVSDNSIIYQQSALPEGTYTYQLSACNESDECHVSATMTITVVAPYIEKTSLSGCGEQCIQLEGMGFDNGLQLTIADMRNNRQLPAGSYSFVRVSQNLINLSLMNDAAEALNAYGLKIRLVNPNGAKFQYAAHSSGTYRPSLTDA